MRPALATAASTARPTEASSVTSNLRTWIGSDSFCASVVISAAFLAFRPPGSRIVAKTVCPLRARVSVNSLPKPVLEPVMRTTCLEFMLCTPCLLWRYRAATTLMPEATFYGASKLALEGYTRSAAAELGRWGITVNAVSLGPVQAGWIPPELEQEILPTIPIGKPRRSLSFCGLLIHLAQRIA